MSIWLWFTVLFANFAEAMAEGRSKAQANSLKGVKTAFARSCARRSMMRLSTIFRPRIYAKAMWCWWKQAILFPRREVIEGGASVDEKAPSPVNPLR